MKTQELRQLVREEVKKILKETEDNVFYGPNHIKAAKNTLVDLTQLAKKLELMQLDIEKYGPRLESIEDAIDAVKIAIEQIKTAR